MANFATVRIQRVLARQGVARQIFVLINWVHVEHVTNLIYLPTSPVLRNKQAAIHKRGRAMSQRVTSNIQHLTYKCPGGVTRDKEEIIYMSRDQTDNPPPIITP